MPYLRVFDPSIGCREFDLDRDSMVIGRASNADVHCQHKSVSRNHAVIRMVGNQPTLQDAGSAAGTIVNGLKIERAVPLRHCDTILVGNVAIEFRDDDEERAKSLSNPDDTLIQSNMRMTYRRMPSSVKLRFRTLSVSPEEIFYKGDTLMVKGGGVLVHAFELAPEGSCVELEISISPGKRRNLLGEVMMHLPGQVPAMCVKLHQVSPEVFDKAVANSRRGVWENARDRKV